MPPEPSDEHVAAICGVLIDHGVQFVIIGGMARLGAELPPDRLAAFATTLNDVRRRIAEQRGST